MPRLPGGNQHRRHARSDQIPSQDSSRARQCQAPAATQEAADQMTKPRPATALRPTCLALPVPLLAWLDQQAHAHGMSRNAYVGLLLHVARRDAERGEP